MAAAGTPAVPALPRWQTAQGVAWLHRSIYLGMHLASMPSRRLTLLATLPSIVKGKNSLLRQYRKVQLPLNVIAFRCINGSAQECSINGITTWHEGSWSPWVG